MNRLVATLPLISLLSTAAAVSLADFKPQIPNLPANCNNVYTLPIEECVAEDFQGDNACSDRCVGALQELVPYVDRACRGVRVGADTIIGIFQAGNGVTRLCPNSRAPVPAPVPPPSSGQDSFGDADDSPMQFAPPLEPDDQSSSAFDLEGSTAFPTDDDDDDGFGASRPSQTGSGDGADETDDASDEEGGEDDEEGGDGADGSPFDEDAENDAISTSRPDLLCLALLLAALGTFNII